MTASGVGTSGAELQRDAQDENNNKIKVGGVSFHMWAL
jgi:hypothetical protein